MQVHGLHKAEGAWYVITHHPAGPSLNELLTLVSERRRSGGRLRPVYLRLAGACSVHHGPPAERARLAGWGSGSESVIWHAATYTAQDVDAVTAKLPEALRVPLSKMLQREPAARYPSAGELAVDLRRWLGGSYGMAEAAAEANKASAEAGEALVEPELRTPRHDPRTTQGEASA